MNLAYAYGAHRQWETAEAYGSEAQQRYETIGNLILAADAQRLAIGCQIQCGRSRESIATLEQALAFTQEIENVWGQVGVCRFLAGAHGELGHYGQAITYSPTGAQARSWLSALPLTTVARIILGIAQRIIMALDAAQEALLAIMRIHCGRRLGYFSRFDAVGTMRDVRFSWRLDASLRVRPKSGAVSCRGLVAADGHDELVRDRSAPARRGRRPGPG